MTIGGAGAESAAVKIVGSCLAPSACRLLTCSDQRRNARHEPIRKNSVVAVSMGRDSLIVAQAWQSARSAKPPGQEVRHADSREVGSSGSILYGFLDGLAPETDETAEVIQDMTA
jgi:hypothetical protein